MDSKTKDIKEAEKAKENQTSFSSILKKTWVVRNIAFALTIAAIISAIATYIAITHSSNPFGPDPEIVIPLVLIDLVLLLALSSIISWKLSKLYIARRMGSVGSRLQTRTIIMFSLVSVVPTIIIAVFSVLFFNFAIKSWFDQRVGTALEESVAVAEGYLQEHKENIRADILAMANDLNRQAIFLVKSPKRFKKVVSTQAALRYLTEAIVFRSNKVLAKTDLSFTLMFEMEQLPPDTLERAANGEVVVLTNDSENRVRALIKLNHFIDTYLIVGRFVDSKVLQHMETTKGSVNEYQRLKANISSLQIQFSFVFVGVALLLLLAAIWVGIVFAGELVDPLSTLITATERVKAGDFDSRVKEGPRNDEIGTLSRAFNRMTGQLQKQRNELVEVNRQTDERRRLIEGVLSGVSAGIIAVDSKKIITIFNRPAPELLHVSEKEMKNKELVSVFPEVKELLKKAETVPEKVIQDEITISREDKKSTLLVRIVTEEFINEIEGYIITFDDITELLTAQRTAAWSDVARRIAHEIKNPLTPIHLAAERLKKKYRPQITSDPESFDKYMNSINRHVDNIKKIVEEFVNFARMPLPSLAKIDICEVIRETVFSEQVVNPKLEYDLNLPEESVIVNGDKGQINQVLINLLKNASEAISNQESKQKDKGKIKISVEEKEYTNIKIEDNGVGFDSELIDRITEPYVTTREKGTGLGLAIVKKVMVDHEGKLSLNNINDSNKKIKGALVTLSFPRLGKNNQKN